MIDRATIDKVMDASNIVEVVSEFVTLRKRGVNYVGLCPFHDDKTPSFYVSPAKNFCKCFACGKGGNAVHFIMEHEQLTYPEAIRWLAKKYNIEIQEKELTPEELVRQNERESMFVVNNYARDYFMDVLHNTSDGKSIGMTYFHQRGIHDDMIQKFQLGYSIRNNRAFSKEALRKGYKEEFLTGTGLSIKHDDGTLRDRFWGRVMYPWHTITGKVVAFSGRVLESNAKVAKYVNSPESDIYQKRKELYGLYFAKQAIVKQSKVYLVEGQMDVISMHQCGIENVVANSGTSLTSEQIRLLHRFTNNITLLYDGDAAGIHASMRGIDLLLSEGMNIKVLLLPNGEDPDSFARTHNASEFQEFINEHEEDFIRFKTRVLMDEAKNDPVKRAQLIANIAQSISQIPDKIIRFTYSQECASILQVDEKIILNEFEKYVKKRKEGFLSEQREQRERKDQELNKTMKQIRQSNDVTSLPEPPMQDAGIPIPETLANNITMEENIPDPPFDNMEPIVEEKPSTTYISSSEREKFLFYAKEKELMRVIVRYGECSFCKIQDENGKDKNLSVLEFIYKDLNHDGLQFHNPLHNRMIEEGMKHIKESGFTCEHFYINHPDQEISMEAVDLLSKKYQLSKLWNDNSSERNHLEQDIPEIILSYKSTYVKEEMDQINRKLVDPDIMKDNDQIVEIMKRCKELSQIQKQISLKNGQIFL
ncbi:MAG: DNA primase [Phocaeicola sp.]|uniref:DNA primase n=1 Tax=Phocaeicola sp. TaxID=2773926 RepID=UPI003FA093A8